MSPRNAPRADCSSSTGATLGRGSQTAGVDKLDQAILVRAFRGELVPQDPNDEPAAVLLARIGREQRERGKRG